MKYVYPEGGFESNEPRIKTCYTVPKLVMAEKHLPGSADGGRAAEFAQKYLDIDTDQDEQLLTVAKTNSCRMDAVQAISGYTFGKGNLIFT